MDKGSESHSQGLIGKAKKTFGELPVMGLLCCLFFLPFIAENVGFKRAAAEQSFWVASFNNAKYAMLRKYDDNFIFVKLEDFKKGKDSELHFTNQFLLRKEIGEKLTLTPRRSIDAKSFSQLWTAIFNENEKTPKNEDLPKPKGKGSKKSE